MPGPNTSIAQRAPQPVSIAAFVAEQVAHAPGAFEKRGCCLDVADIAGRQHQRIRAPDDVGEYMDLGGPATTRAADRLRRAAPFCAERRALCLDVGAVDRGAFRDRAGVHQGIEQLQPEAAVRPTVEAVVNRGRRAVIGWAVAPAATDLQYVQEPEITRRSSTRRAPGWFFGRCGSIAAHASSDNQNSAFTHLP